MVFMAPKCLMVTEKKRYWFGKVTILFTLNVLYVRMSFPQDLIYIGFYKTKSFQFLIILQIVI